MEPQAPGAPGNLTIRLNQSSMATLSWTAPGGQDGYVLVDLQGEAVRSRA